MGLRIQNYRPGAQTRSLLPQGGMRGSSESNQKRPEGHLGMRCRIQKGHFVSQLLCSVLWSQSRESLFPRGYLAMSKDSLAVTTRQFHWHFGERCY